jgi:hypothetical protein
LKKTQGAAKPLEQNRKRSSISLKSQIPSTKLQINPKFQASNSKHHANDLNCFDFFSIDENIFFNSSALLQDHKVSNFEFRLLYFFCYLEFVIWNFH